MTDQTQIQADAAVDAPAKVVKAVAATADKIVTETTKTAKRASTARRTKRSAKRVAKTAKPAVATRKSRRAKTTRTAARKPAAAAFNQRIPTMNFVPKNVFEGFNAFTGNSPFQAFFTETGERSQEVVKKSQKVAQELTDPLVPTSKRSSRPAALPPKARVRSARTPLLAAVKAPSRLPTRSVRSPKPSRRPSSCSSRASSPARRSTAWLPRLRA